MRSNAPALAAARQQVTGLAATMLRLVHMPCVTRPCCCSHAIVSSSVGPEYYVNVLSFVDKSQLEPGCTVLLHNKVAPSSLAVLQLRRSAQQPLCSQPATLLQVLSVVGLLQDEADPMVSVMKVRPGSATCGPDASMSVQGLLSHASTSSMPLLPQTFSESFRMGFKNSVHAVCQDGRACNLQVEKAPLESYADVGGLEQQITEIKEAVELPLTHPELYEDIGIKPPKAGCPAGWLADQSLHAGPCAVRPVAACILHACSTSACEVGHHGQARAREPAACLLLRTWQALAGQTHA